MSQREWLVVGRCVCSSLVVALMQMAASVVAWAADQPGEGGMTPRQVRICTSAGSGVFYKELTVAQKAIVPPLLSGDVVGVRRALSPYFIENGELSGDLGTALIVLEDYSWSIDMGPFEDLLRECSVVRDDLCSNALVRFKLPFANRTWVTGLLARVLAGQQNPVDYDGLWFEMERCEAVEYVLELGVEELRPMAKAVVSVPGPGGTARCHYSEDDVTEVFDLLGGSRVGEHPATWMARGLSSLGDNRVLQLADRGSPVLELSRLMMKNLVCRSDGYEHADTDRLPPLMVPLGGAYLSFLEDPMSIAGSKTTPFQSLNDQIVARLGGGCMRVFATENGRVEWKLFDHAMKDYEDWQDEE